MTGLLDALTDPVLMAEINERRCLAVYIGARLGMTAEDAHAMLYADDIAAIEMFQVGNTLPADFRN